MKLKAASASMKTLIVNPGERITSMFCCCGDIKVSLSLSPLHLLFLVLLLLHQHSELVLSHGAFKVDLRSLWRVFTCWSVWQKRLILKRNWLLEFCFQHDVFNLICFINKYVFYIISFFQMEKLMWNQWLKQMMIDLTDISINGSLS